MPPLMLSRVGTVYSFSQLEEEVCEGPAPPSELALAPEGAAATPDKPVRALADGCSLLPRYAYPSKDGAAAKRIRSFGDLADAAAPAVPDVDDLILRDASSSSDSEDGDSLGSGGSAQVVPQRSTLDGLLLSEWEDRAERGLFRYDVTACPTRVLRGAYGFVAQLNEGRASKKRATEFCVDVVAQPFDAAKFNFTKALQAEVLFQFEPSGAARPAFAPAAPPGASPTLVLINVSPIEYGHCLLVPRALDGLNQLVAPDTMLTALKLAREADNPFFRLGFNSLGAYGTINHLHFQAYYLAAPFPCERAPTVPLPAYPDLARPRRRGGLRVCALAQYPVRGLVFEAGDSLAEMAAVVGRACQRLTERNIPHNLFVADAGARVFLFPNCFASRKATGQIPEEVMDTQVDPACWEIAGHMVLKRAQDYEVATEEWAWRLLAYATCDEAAFTGATEIALGKAPLRC